MATLTSSSSQTILRDFTNVRMTSYYPDQSTNDYAELYDTALDDLLEASGDTVKLSVCVPGGACLYEVIAFEHRGANPALGVPSAADVTEVHFKCPECGGKSEIEGLCEGCRKPRVLLTVRYSDEALPSTAAMPELGNQENLALPLSKKSLCQPYKMFATQK